MRQIRLSAHAKITLTLDVLRRLGDGYHELKSVMQQIGLKDQIRILETKDNDIRISSDTMNIPLDQNNLVWKAVDLLRRRCNVTQGVDVHIKKNIPIEGGLAGGSADAACVIDEIDQHDKDKHQYLCLVTIWQWIQLFYAINSKQCLHRPYVPL